MQCGRETSLHYFRDVIVSSNMNEEWVIISGVCLALYRYVVVGDIHIS